MPDLVVDASVIVNALAEQPLTPQATAVLESDLRLLSTTTARMEAASALWLAARCAGLDRLTALERLASLDLSPIAFLSFPELNVRALELGLEHDLSPYDAEYIALAIAQDCGLVTADREQLRIASERCGLGERAIWLGDI